MVSPFYRLADHICRHAFVRLARDGSREDDVVGQIDNEGKKEALPSGQCPSMMPRKPSLPAKRP